MTLRVRWVDGGSSAGEAALPQGLQACELHRATGLDAAVAGALDHEVVVLSVAGADEALRWRPLLSLCAEVAVLIWLPRCAPDKAALLLQCGVQDIVCYGDESSLAQRLALAIERHRIASELKRTHATDLMTGLPNRAQLIEHMSQLLAMREREPRPVSLLVLRIDGLGGVAAAHGEESANVARRKVAVRLRAAVRASDVVAAIGPDAFAVLLPSMESSADARHVVDKLGRAVRQPLAVAGGQTHLMAQVGSAHYPEDGKQPETLLRHAAGAALLAAYGPKAAAND